MKRFYKLVSTRADNGGYLILLDGKPIKTPLKNILRAGTEKMADAVAAEWAAQKEKIKFTDMPLTQILYTRIDRVGNDRAAMTHIIMNYLDTDLICYRADHPPEIAAAQAAAWDPWINWFKSKTGTELKTTTGLTALNQSETAHKSVREIINAMNDDMFTVFQIAAGFAGSIVLGLAFADCAMNADEIFAAARVEENFKAILYNESEHGPDPAQDQKDRAAIADLKAAEMYRAFLKTN
jgi:chaperone required for assembly of F1-ATPase